MEVYYYIVQLRRRLDKRVFRVHVVASNPLAASASYKASHFEFMGITKGSPDEQNSVRP